MPEASQTTSDEAGVTRTPTGTIVDQSPTSTPPSTETIVRPQPTPTTTPSETKPETRTETKTEAKTDGKDSKETGKSLLGEKGAPEGAPEKYADFTVPEGFTLDADTAKDASAIFKKHNLSQAGAQELVDFYIAKTREAQQRPYDVFQDMRQKWRDEINSDPDIGGTKLKGTIATISKLIDSSGDAQSADAFRAAMDETGAGDHPAVLRKLNEWARRLTEGGPVRGSGPSSEGQRVPGSGAPSAAQAIYPNLPSSRG